MRVRLLFQLVKKFKCFRSTDGTVVQDRDREAFFKYGIKYALFVRSFCKHADKAVWGDEWHVMGVASGSDGEKLSVPESFNSVIICPLFGNILLIRSEIHQFNAVEQLIFDQMFKESAGAETVAGELPIRVGGDGIASGIADAAADVGKSSRLAEFFKCAVSEDVTSGTGRLLTSDDDGEIASGTFCQLKCGNRAAVGVVVGDGTEVETAIYDFCNHIFQALTVGVVGVDMHISCEIPQIADLHHLYPLLSEA